jgi:hypothetical protein
VRRYRRSRRGPSNKIRALVDAIGRPIRLAMTQHDLVHGQLHVPEVGFAQVHPGSQKIVPHVGAMHAPAWLFAAVQRHAA